MHHGPRQWRGPRWAGVLSLLRFRGAIARVVGHGPGRGFTGRKVVSASARPGEHHAVPRNQYLDAAGRGQVRGAVRSGGEGKCKRYADPGVRAKVLWMWEMAFWGGRGVSDWGGVGVRIGALEPEPGLGSSAG